MNDALRLAPMFTNNERYQFRAHVRPAFAALPRFIKDVAQYGSTEDLLGGAGALPTKFEELMRKKTVTGAARSGRGRNHGPAPSGVTLEA
ncbi:hypothetical protein WL93_00060 [Burkholderia diffusa]|uniref:hypothetical protein n=1 Tax=Burkholderia diffusa TaxID=488732 RepID=UPI0007592D80|nr:hypothetical protein [Burkholderia diffusa]KWF95443.1 hypothetical protein WL93_00060 [Burkholderia diffusa]